MLTLVEFINSLHKKKIYIYLLHLKDTILKRVLRWIDRYYLYLDTSPIIIRKKYIYLHLNSPVMKIEFLPSPPHPSPHILNIQHALFRTIAERNVKGYNIWAVCFYQVGQKELDASLLMDCFLVTEPFCLVSLELIPVFIRLVLFKTFTLMV